MKSLSYLNKYFLKYKWRLLLGILFLVGTNFFKVKIPVYVGDRFDGIKDLRKKLEQAISSTDNFGRDARSIMNTLSSIKNPEQVNNAIDENTEKIKILK